MFPIVEAAVMEITTTEVSTITMEASTTTMEDSTTTMEDLAMVRRRQNKSYN